MNKFSFLIFLFLLSNIVIGQKKPFEKLKIYYSHLHEGSKEFEYQIINNKNKLYLIESDRKQEIEYFKLRYITDFINEVKNRIIDTCKGIEWSGTYRLDLNIDNKKITLKDCPDIETDGIGLSQLIAKLKKDRIKLKEDTNKLLDQEVYAVMNAAFNDKLTGCWNINKGFRMDINQILLLSKDKKNDKYQWCFKDGNLKTTSENKFLYKSKLTKKDSIEYYPNGIWFSDFPINYNNLAQIELTHNEYIGEFDKDRTDDYNHKFLKFVFSIIEFKEDLIILELIEKKTNADNEYNSLIEENKN